MTDKKKTSKIPTDPAERKAYFAALGSKGGYSRAKSEKAVYPFRDTPGLAKKAGSTKGYTFDRKKSDDGQQ